LGTGQSEVLGYGAKVVYRMPWFSAVIGAGVAEVQVFGGFSNVFV
jgi:hypothetical protein